ncbi:MAG: ATP-binding protein [Nitrospiraceae bacterium]|nr:MAG: ATP-binding protein [Nitrospiraceae bacterium]
MTHLSDENFETFFFSLINRDAIDLRDITFIDPCGMVGLLDAGRYLSLNNKRKTLALPASGDVLKYLERMDFFRFAGRYFDLVPEAPDLSGKFLRSSGTDVLLEITPIEKSDDIHFIVGKVKKRAHKILEKHLHYDDNAINGFIVALSEVCQNIIEHSENTGLVGIQKYHFQKLNKNVVKIAVTDLGIGFRKSLATRFPIRDDMEALEKALLHGLSRHVDEGRGHGLAAVKRFVNRWDGKLSIRSGNAKLSIIPDWGWGKKRETGLAYFPGSYINIMLLEV